MAPGQSRRRIDFRRGLWSKHSYRRLLRTNSHPPWTSPGRRWRTRVVKSRCRGARGALSVERKSARARAGGGRREFFSWFCWELSTSSHKARFRRKMEHGNERFSGWIQIRQRRERREGEMRLGEGQRKRAPAFGVRGACSRFLEGQQWSWAMPKRRQAGRTPNASRNSEALGTSRQRLECVGPAFGGVGSR